MDVTAVHLLPECYRGSSPRSASTPGPAPDSPASASGRFSASPLLSPFPYYSHLAVAAAAAHGSGPLGLIGGLGASFLSSNSLLAPYGLGLGLHSAMSQLPAGLSSPPSSLTSLGHLQRLQQLQLPSPAGTHSAPSRALPFSVENILKPEFGHKNGPQAQATSPVAADVKKCDVEDPASPKEHKAIKRPLEPATCKVESRGPSSPKIRCTDDKLATVKPDPVDLSSGNSNSSNSSSSKGTELPTDPTKMTDPSKWPAWIFCTRYSDRPSSGPRSRRIKKDRKVEEKRPRTAFTAEQLARLKNEFTENRYLNEKRRQDLARELGLHENQIKIWFQNKRAKIKKTTGQKNPLALQLMAQGLYNHSTVPVDEDEDEEFRQQCSD